MNEKEILLKNQARKLKEFIDSFIKCCENKRFYEKKRFEVPYIESKTLLFLKDHRYLTINELAYLLDVTKSRASNIVKNLTEKRFVEVMPDPKDKRIKLVSLTDKGKEKVKEIEEFQLEIHKKLLNGFDLSERITLLNLIERLKLNMDIIKEEIIGNINQKGERYGNKKIRATIKPDQD